MPFYLVKVPMEQAWRPPRLKVVCRAEDETQALLRADACWIGEEEQDERIKTTDHPDCIEEYIKEIKDHYTIEEIDRSTVLYNVEQALDGVPNISILL